MIDQHLNTISETTVAFKRCLLGIFVAITGGSLSAVEAATVYLRFFGAIAALVASVVTICVGLRALRNRKDKTP